MSIPCDKTFLLIPSSRSSVKVKVKYQDNILGKKWHSLPFCKRQVLDSSILNEFADGNFKFDENGRNSLKGQKTLLV